MLSGAAQNHCRQPLKRDCWEWAMALTALLHGLGVWVVLGCLHCVLGEHVLL